MRKYLYISLVGTSLLRNLVFSNNYRGLLEKYRDYRYNEWFRLSPDDELNTVPDGFLCNPPREIEDALHEMVRRDPEKAAAEINGILNMIKLYYHSIRDVEVLLINTKTCNSRLCSKIIRNYLIEQGFEVESVEIEAMKSIDEFEDGIIELLDHVIPWIREAKENGRFVYVNATPGFKPETTFLVIASLLAGADSIAYIHEAFRKAISLPLPPIKLDERIREVEKLFGRERCIDTSIARELLGDQVLSHYIDRGVLEYSEDKTKTCMRRWVGKLLEKIAG